MLDLQNAEIFRAALESLQSGVCVVDRDRKICYWNDGAERITGYLRQDVLGRFCGDILLIKSHEKKATLCDQFCPLVAAMRDGRVREARVYLHHKAGYAVPVGLRASPIRDSTGNVVGATESFIATPWVSHRDGPASNLTALHGLDTLTQLPDCLYTESYLADRLQFASEHAIPFGLLNIQLDHLDNLKATHGIQAVEAMLNVVAHTLRNGIDSQDFVGRWANDQFLVIAATSAIGELTITAERLKRLIRSSEIVWWGDQLSVTASLGGTLIGPGESMEALMERVRTAGDQAIASGGNSAVVLPAPEPSQ